MSSRKNKLEVLGAYGSKYKDMNPATFLLNNSICIDGGSILEKLNDRIFGIEHIFLTHSHFDHIGDIPYLIDITYPERKNTLYIYGLSDTLNVLKSSIFNYDVWPDFSKIKLPSSGRPALQFIEISFFNEYFIEGLKIKPFPSEHTVPTAGFIINDQILISGDTISIDQIIEEVNINKKIENIFIDVSFPEKLGDIALKSKHHSTESIRQLIHKINPSVKIFGYHMKPLYLEEIKYELRDENISFLKEGDRFYFL